MKVDQNIERGNDIVDGSFLRINRAVNLLISFTYTRLLVSPLTYPASRLFLSILQTTSLRLPQEPDKKNMHTVVSPISDLIVRRKSISDHDMPIQKRPALNPRDQIKRRKDGR
jgi:hypothetical protein